MSVGNNIILIFLHFVIYFQLWWVVMKGLLTFQDSIIFLLLKVSYISHLFKWKACDAESPIC